MDANEHYQQGLAILADPSRFTAAGAAEARALFEEALKLDEQFWRAHAELAYVHVREAQNGWSADRAASFAMAEEHVEQALAINDDFHGHWSRAMVYWNQGRFAESFLEYGLARRLNPDDPDLDADEAEALTYAGAAGKAITQIEEAMARKPDFPYWYRWNLARARYMVGHYQEAIDAIGQMAGPPEDVLLVTAASKARLGDLEAARADMAEFSAYDPEWSIAKSAQYPYRNAADREHWLGGLRLAGLKEA